jgi:hypothetical protein
LDWNGDGLKDLLVAERGNLRAYADQLSPFVRVYINTGVSPSPTFSSGEWLPMRRSVLVLPEDVQGIRVADWDGDGAEDLLAGSVDGIWVCLNEGPASAVSFGPWQQVCPTGSSSCRFPRGWLNLDFSDWNGDGRSDLIVGIEYRVNQRDLCAGTRDLVYVYLNTGSRTEPRFAGGFRVDLESGVPLDVLGNLPSPALADWDDDDKPDLILGGSEACGGRFGGVFLFERNVGTEAAPLLSGASFYDYGPWRVGENCTQ